jgi:hypothetical protein
MDENPYKAPGEGIVAGRTSRRRLERYSMGCLAIVLGTQMLSLIAKRLIVWLMTP